MGEHSHDADVWGVAAGGAQVISMSWLGPKPELGTGGSLTAEGAWAAS